MSKKAIGIAVVVIILLLGGIVAFTRFNKPAAPSTEQAMITAQPSSSPAKTKGTIQNLLTFGTNISCQVAMPEQNSSGTVYVSGNKFRGDFNVKIKDQDSVTHMLQADGFAYVWADGGTTGTKIDLEAIKKIGNATQSAQVQSQNAELSKERDLNCTPWSADQSKFAVPTDIKFTDLTQTLKNLPATKSGTIAPKMDASICNQLTDPQAKANCLKALNGN